MEALPSAVTAVDQRVPLVNGAKVDDVHAFARDLEELARRLRGSAAPGTSLARVRAVAQGVGGAAAELPAVLQEEAALIQQCHAMLGALTALELEERSLKAHCLQRARQVSSVVYPPQRGGAGVLATPSAMDIAAAINVVRDGGDGGEGELMGLAFPEMPMEAAATPAPPFVGS
mmetsp:Transcript_52520/g.167021  ORF Transcript_52520/g.167021 Transcript_52520/m.167021 type:complete len:174 (-) Transcript_52520:130-651(-)